jgi:pSer/pThr/pTyr-binding forkhead associated (FHA) protein/Zn-dependent protease with chaperone function
MASDASSGRPIKLRDYRYPGEVVSLVLTFIILVTLYSLATLFFPSSWEQTIKALAFTALGLAVYIVSVLVQQRAAFGTLVRIGPRQFPELNERAQQAAECLSSPPVPVYVKRASEMNIYTLGFWRQPIIVVTSSLVDQMDQDNLQFFIGREIGHVQAGHTWLRTLLKPVGSEVPVIGKLLNSVIFGDWINRTELTADRAGFIACRSLTTSVSTMLKFGVGIRLYEKLDISEFLQQLNELHNVRGRVTEIVAEQPYLTKRVRALVRFALSEQFQTIVPEKRTYTQILSALPQNFFNSGQIKADFQREPERTPVARAARKIETEVMAMDEPMTQPDPVNQPNLALLLVTIDKKESHFLRHQRTRIGRNRDNDIVVSNDRVSRYHAEILREGNNLSIVDLGSRNGVRLNGWRISTPAELKPGDIIRIGGQEFTFVSREE